MKKYLAFLFLAFSCVGEVCCQSNQNQIDYVLSKELIKRKSDEFFATKGRIVGYAKDKLVLKEFSMSLSENLFLLDERDFKIGSFVTIQNQTSKTANTLVINDKIISQGFMTVHEQYKKSPLKDIPIDPFPYQDIWIQQGEKTLKIDTYPYNLIDKYYKPNFSLDSRYLTVNPYTDNSAGYWKEDDDRFYIYDLNELGGNNIKKQSIKCERCLNSIVVNNNRVLFVREIAIGKGFDGYYRNIYTAPLKNVSDTLKIAHDINIITISTDGKFILGQKYLYGRYVPVILNIATKRFQYLLGRDYPIDYSFYSPLEKKFAFDLGTHIVYIDFPETYPFDALSKKILKTSKSQDSTFWQKYKHEGL